MNKQQERDIHLIGLALLLALSAAVQPHSDVQPQPLSDEALQTTRNHRRRADGLAPAPDGTIHDSVLWVFAQCLIYSGSVLGVTGFLKSSREVDK